MCPSTSGRPPSPRQGHTCAVVGNRLFVHGGMAGSDIFGDLYVLDLGMQSVLHIAFCTGCKNVSVPVSGKGV